MTMGAYQEPNGPIQILLADDHPIVREGLRCALTADTDGIQFRIHEASTSYQAIKKGTNPDIDIILMDYALPDQGGIVAIREILKARPNVKILALSHYNDESIIEEMIHAGCRGYLTKSVEQHELIRAIKKVLAGEPYLSGEPGTQLVKSGKHLHLVPQNKNRLTKREQEVLAYILKECTNEEIAEILKRSVRTIETHRSNIMEKLGAKTTVGLIKIALELGLEQKPSK